VPPAALREALVNAVVHADYARSGAPIRVAVFDDRVEVENPGVLLAGLTIEDIREGVSRVRNRVMARVFHELGLVEQWGTGVQRMVASCVEAGLPDPEFAELGFRFRVTIRTDRSAAPALDRIDDRIVSYLRAEGVGRPLRSPARSVSRRGPSSTGWRRWPNAARSSPWAPGRATRAGAGSLPGRQTGPGGEVRHVRPDEVRGWTPEFFYPLGLHRFRGTVRHPGVVHASV
jgi:hypothetical protein